MALRSDALLDVFCYLSDAELLLARGVCRRWREVAMDKWAWSRRELEVNDGTLEKAIVRQAPCLGRLRIRGTHNWDVFHCAKMFPLPLGYSSLSTDVDAETVRHVVAELHRRRQAVDGLTLQHLDLEFCGTGEVDVRPLLRAINDCRLESLRVRGCGHREVDEDDPMRPGEASLRTLQYLGIAAWPDPVVRFLVTTHAATLTDLTLLGPEAGRVPVSLLSECTALAHLACHLLEGMEAMHCPSLEHLRLVLSHSTLDRCGPAAAFVREAALLRHLVVETSRDASLALPQFLKQLAGPPGPPPALWTLHVAVNRQPDQSWQELAGAIECLKASCTADISLDVDHERPDEEEDDHEGSDHGDERLPFDGDGRRPPAELVGLLAGGCLRTLRYRVLAEALPCPVHPNYSDSGALGAEAEAELQESCDSLSRHLNHLRHMVCQHPQLHVVGLRWRCFRRSGGCDWWRQHAPRELQDIGSGWDFHVYGHADVGRCDLHRESGVWVKLGDS